MRSTWGKDLRYLTDDGEWVDETDPEFMAPLLRGILAAIYGEDEDTD